MEVFVFENVFEAYTSGDSLEYVSGSPEMEIVAVLLNKNPTKK